MLFSAGSAGVGACQAGMREVSPAPALHALHGFMLQPARSDVQATYFQAVPNAEISCHNIFEDEYRVCCSLSIYSLLVSYESDYPVRGYRDACLIDGVNDTDSSLILRREGSENNVGEFDVVDNLPYGCKFLSQVG